jgi:uncharacterized membrane protein YjjP (DUF1212 family)
MDTDKFQKDLDETFENIKSYVDLKTELFKLIIFEKVAKILSKAFTLIIIVFVLFFVMLFLSLAFVHWFETNGGMATHAYMIVAVFYLIIGIIIFLSSTRLFLNPMIKGFSDTALEDDDEFLDSGKKEGKKK